jgi:exocyst complex component 1
LQVQTANQKALQRELKGLLTTITVPQSVLDVLKQSSLIVDKPDPAEHARALQSLENPLMALYKALTTIDPSIVQAESANSKDLVSDENFGNMRALQDKKIGYLQECRTFLGRLKQFLEIKFKAEAMDAAKLGDATLDAQGRPRLTSLDGFYFKMYKFTSLILFARDMDKNDYYEIQRVKYSGIDKSIANI